MPEFSAAVQMLQDQNRVSRSRFRQLAQRLANGAAIYPDDSKLERELYEDFLAVEDELRDYFEVIGCGLVHNLDLRYVRLFPPEASSPIATRGIDEDFSDEGNGAGSSLMRRRTNAHLMGVALALRLIYSQKLSSGDIIGHGEVATTVEEIYVTLRTRLKREPAAQQAERKAVIRELENGWRVIRLAVEADVDDPATRVVIRPMLADLVSESIALRMEADIAALTGKNENQGEASLETDGTEQGD